MKSNEKCNGCNVGLASDEAVYCACCEPGAELGAMHAYIAVLKMQREELKKQLAETRAHLACEEAEKERDDLRVNVQTLRRVAGMALERMLDEEFDGYDVYNGERCCPCCAEWKYSSHGSASKHGYACGYEATMAELRDALGVI